MKTADYVMQVFCIVKVLELQQAYACSTEWQHKLLMTQDLCL
jgi:hypothetical protein